MHSRIFQLEKKKDAEIVSEYDMIEIVEDSDLYCDYIIMEEGDRKINSINWLLDSLNSLGLSKLYQYNKLEQSIVFKKGFKEQFFKDKFAKFKKRTSELSFEDFCSDRTFCLYAIRETMDDKYGFRIYSSDLYYISLDSFVRYINEGEKFYIMSTFDYHY